MKHLYSIIAVLLALSSACQEPCEGIEPAPLEGTYRDLLAAVGAGADAFMDPTLEVTGDTVVLTYSRPSGARYRAVYRITGKRIGR